MIQGKLLMGMMMKGWRRGNRKRQLRVQAQWDNHGAKEETQDSLMSLNEVQSSSIKFTICSHLKRVYNVE